MFKTSLTVDNQNVDSNYSLTKYCWSASSACKSCTILPIIPCSSAKSSGSSSSAGWSFWSDTSGETRVNTRSTCQSENNREIRSGFAVCWCKWQRASVSLQQEQANRRSSFEPEQRSVVSRNLDKDYPFPWNTLARIWFGGNKPFPASESASRFPARCSQCKCSCSFSRCSRNTRTLGRSARVEAASTRCCSCPQESSSTSSVLWTLHCCVPSWIVKRIPVSEIVSRERHTHTQTHRHTHTQRKKGSHCLDSRTDRCVQQLLSNLCFAWCADKLQLTDPSWVDWISPRLSQGLCPRSLCVLGNTSVPNWPVQLAEQQYLQEAYLLGSESGYSTTMARTGKKKLFAVVQQVKVKVHNSTWIIWAICSEKMSNSWISVGIPLPSSFLANWANLHSWKWFSFWCISSKRGHVRRWDTLHGGHLTCQWGKWWCFSRSPPRANLHKHARSCSTFAGGSRLGKPKTEKTGVQLTNSQTTQD